MNFKIFVLGIMVFSMLFGCIEPTVDPGNETNITEPAELKKFASMDELKSFLKNNMRERQVYYDAVAMPMMAENAKGASEAADDGGSSDYSTTNVQVEGVDEADFVKTDGAYIYVLSGNKLVILDAYPAVDAKILSETEIEGSANEFFINGDDLVVFVHGYPDAIAYEKEEYGYGYGYGYTGIIHYDISDRTNPEVKEETYVEGNYFDSRMIRRNVYVIVNKNVWYYGEDEDQIAPPVVYRDGENDSGVFPEIYYPDLPAYSYTYSTVLSIDLDNDEQQKKLFLVGDATDMYVSSNNIYLVHDKFPDVPGPMPLVEEVAAKIIMPPEWEYNEETAIHRIAIEEGKIAYEASGSVPGHVLNQFSMDEHDEHFRIATTVGHVARFEGQASSKNNVYVLDSDLEIVGKIEDLAPGEKIYSARFMGGRGYIVTFRKVDPLFVIDLNDPEKPEVLGKLKIPGYSDYLHPYDENHVIGLGKEAIPADDGDFSWYQGVKLSLFDITDVEKPKEISKFDIGERGTESYALHDHKAFLFSKKKNLLVIPILLAEIDEEQYPTGIEPWQHGDYTFQGAYVFNVDTENGFKLKGTVSHVEDEDEYAKSGYYFYSEYDVKRSLFIEDVLYTISDSKVVMNELNTLEQVNEVDLPYEQEDYYWYYE